MPEPAPRNLTPAKLDAIHRSVLSGLLGNVGFKADAHEYTGARGIKFFLFPGSGLFNRKPPWVVAADLVETTRLYARTAAAIRPEWIERLAAHLVARTYSEPHWQEKSGHVAAYEKVSLYGLVVVPKRLVHYGPIDPRLSREIFIHHALVLGEFHTAAPFFKHNRALVEQVRQLEAKARVTDVMVDQQMQFAFYDAKVPEGVFNGPTFETWRREAERGNPQLLFMTTQDLMRRGADEVTPDRFPDEVHANGMRLPLSYKLAPGEADDGVTVTLPLAALNGVREDRLDWLVPGLLPEKIEAMIRNLPKHLRTSFVPVPDVARDAARTLKPGDGPLSDALAAYLGKRSGLQIPAASLAAAEVPDFLRMHVRVVDAKGNEIAHGRDLAQIRKGLGQQAKETFAQLPPSQYHRDGITTWDFGDLPERVEVRRHGMTLPGYPALVDAGTSVSLRLMDSPEAAAQATRGGLRRLFILRFQGELKYLAGSMPDIDKMCLYYAPIGSCAELKQDLTLAITDRVFLEGQPPVRTKAAFERAADEAWPKLSRAATEVGDAVAKTLAAHHALTLQLARTYPPLMQPAIADVKQQLSSLVYKNFAVITAPAWLPHVPRFLQAAQSRLNKLTNAGLAKDNAAAAQLAPLLKQSRDRRQKHAAEGVRDPELGLYRWMLEELRVSLFAQELKTSIPISIKRLEQQWAKVKP